MLRFAFGVLLWVLVSPGQPCTAKKVYVYPPDAAVLLEAKAAWGGDSVLPSWNASKPCEQWEGLTCDGSGRATLLDLSYTWDRNKLSGSLPSSIGNLIALQVLNLYRNFLSGSIPASIGNLPRLWYLNLNRNLLSGPIPESLCNLAALQFLDLGFNELSSSIPSCIGNLSVLQELTAWGNALYGSIPSSVGNLSALSSLDLSDNEISGSIPSSIGNLSALKELMAFGNELSGSIPSSIGNLRALARLLLSDNHLSGSLPSSIGSIIAVQYLDLSSNQLSGSIPPSLGNLTALSNLKLGGNQLSGSMPFSVGDMSALQDLSLYHNQLSGSIPSNMVNMSALLSLDLSYNQLSGSIPSGFGFLVDSCEYPECEPRALSLFPLSNKLTGPLPPMAKATLEASNFSDNFLSGSCPSDPLDSHFYGNCFQKCSVDDSTNLRNRTECSKACGSDQPTGPCSGKGTCFISGTKMAPTCVCKPGFVSPASNPGTCVPAPPPPPRPPPGYVTKLCAGAVVNPKNCKCPSSGRCQRKSFCNNMYVCRCVGVKRRPVTDPKTGILKACI